MQLNFVTVDVFTDRQFGGNPLAVVLDGERLTSQQMQSIAAEFNLAETTFVLPPKASSNTAQVRIFTPRAEMPFAGHPNVGTAFVLAREGSCHGRPIAGDTLVFEEKAGLVRLDLLKAGTKIAGASLAAPQALAIGENIAVEIVAEACSLSVSDIETRHHLPCVASCGAPFVFAELRNREALAAAQPRVEVFDRHLARELVTGIHLYTPSAADGVDIHSRMFAPLHGIPEDPATGAANVALIGLLAHLRPEMNLRLEKKIAQGFDMGRPSMIDASAVKTGGMVTASYIGGTCVAMMRGVLDLAASATSVA
jgi:trans-2,3-dihydro-3-hydroxyanthranilate isomerase